MSAQPHPGSPSAQPGLRGGPGGPSPLSSWSSGATWRLSHPLISSTSPNQGLLGRDSHEEAEWLGGKPLGWARTSLTVPRGFRVGSSKQERTPQGGPCFSWAVSVAGCACLFPHGLEVRVSPQKAQTWTCSPCTTWEYTQEEVPPGGGAHRGVCSQLERPPACGKRSGTHLTEGRQWEEMETTIRV